MVCSSSERWCRANERLSVLSAEAPINQPLVTDGTGPPAPRRDEERLRIDGARSAAPHADPVSAHGARRPRRGDRRRAHACWTRDTIRVLAWLSRTRRRPRSWLSRTECRRAAQWKSAERTLNSDRATRRHRVPYNAKLAAQAASSESRSRKSPAGKMAAPSTSCPAWSLAMPVKKAQLPSERLLPVRSRWSALSPC